MKLTFDIYVISRCTHNFYARELKKIGLTMGQFPFLLQIDENDGISQENLSRNLMISKSTTALIIRQLLDSGMISRVKDPEDHRNYNLHITQSGKVLVPKIREIINQCHEYLLQNFPESEKQKAADILEQIRENTVNAFGKEKFFNDDNYASGK